MVPYETLEILLAPFQRCHKAEPGPDVRLGIQNLQRTLRDHPDWMGAVAAQVSNLPPHGAGWVAVSLGVLVENGHPADPSGPCLLEFFEHLLARFPEISDDDEDYPPLDEAQQIWLDAIPNLARALVSHLARLPDRREDWATTESRMTRLEQLEGYSYAFSWVREAIQRHSAQLTVLHVESRQGYRVHYHNVANCFHLFSLLQCRLGTLLPGGQAPDEAVMTAALGGDGQVSDHGWWHYGWPQHTTPEPLVPIWGEGLTRHLPQVNGEALILLWPMTIQRSWDSGFFGPHLDALPANLTVERALSVDEVVETLRQLGVGG